MGGSRRLLWLGAAAAVVVVALALATRAQAASAAAQCASTEGFVPAFCVAVPTAGRRRDTTVPLTSLPASRADVRVEPAVPGVAALEIAAVTDRAVTDVERLFGRGFSARPRLLVFASAASFARGVREVFGYAPETAEEVAARYGGIFDRGTLTIAVSWSAAGGERMASAIAHELAHLMVHDIAGPDAAVPAWLDEGLATVVEQAQADAPGRAEERLVGRALAAAGGMSLDRLEALADFHAAYPRFGRALYAYSAEAVREVVGRVGWDGVVGLLEAVRAGERLGDAYARRSEDTLAALDARLGSAGPEIALTPRDGGVVWTLSSGRPAATVQVAIDGADGYRVTFTVTTDALGTFRGSFGATAAPGTYTLRAAGAEATFVTTR